jgi:hypothetical protein
MNELIERFKSESPEFFKKLKKFAIGVGAAALAFVTANATLNLEINSSLIEVANYIIAIAAAVAGTAQFTKK